MKCNCVEEPIADPVPPESTGCKGVNGLRDDGCINWGERRSEVTLEEMEKRLRTVEDIEQIKQLHHRYINDLTFINWDDVIDCFSENSSIDVQFGGLIKGKANIAGFFKEMLSQIHIGKEGIFMVHPVITVHGDNAKGNWLM
jgi:hypothetical protein